MFPWAINVACWYALRNVLGLGKQNPLLATGSVIKCSVITPYLKEERGEAFHVLTLGLAEFPENWS